MEKRKEVRGVRYKAMNRIKAKEGRKMAKKKESKMIREDTNELDFKEGK